MTKKTIDFYAEAKVVKKNIDIMLGVLEGEIQKIGSSATGPSSRLEHFGKIGSNVQAWDYDNYHIAKIVIDCARKEAALAENLMRKFDNKALTDEAELAYYSLKRIEVDFKGWVDKVEQIRLTVLTTIDAIEKYLSVIKSNIK